MKKSLNRICAVPFLIILIVGLVACNGEPSGADGNQNVVVENQQSPSDKPHEWALDELGTIITAAGQFWEDWWDKSGVFAHTDGTSIFIPTGDYGSEASYTPLLPSSGFTGVDDIRNHLLQFYTERKVDAEMGITFIEQDGRVYFANVRAGFPRFDWTTATHELVEQDGSRAVVETAVMHGYFALEPDGFVALRFHMYDGRISRIEGGSIVRATLDIWAQDAEPWNEFAVHFGDAMLFIAPAYESLLAAFEYIHEMDYYEVRGTTQGDRLAIWANTPLQDFALINISNYDAADGMFFVPISTHGSVDLLLPGQSFVVNNYMGMGTLPWSGVAFTDENGKRHYFAIQHDQSDSPNRFMIMPIEIREKV